MRNGRATDDLRSRVSNPPLTGPFAEVHAGAAMAVASHRVRDLVVSEISAAAMHSALASTGRHCCSAVPGSVRLVPVFRKQTCCRSTAEPAAPEVVCVGLGKRTFPVKADLLTR